MTDYRIVPVKPTIATDFQERVGVWMLACFGPDISFDKLERNDRFIEEALELTQATGYSAGRAHALVDYVFARPVGEPSQEVGGVMVTLAALCNAHGLDFTTDGLRELERIEQPAMMAKIKAKHTAKPTGSALPSAMLSAAPAVDRQAVVETIKFNPAFMAEVMDEQQDWLAGVLADAIFALFGEGE